MSKHLAGSTVSLCVRKSVCIWVCVCVCVRMRSPAEIYCNVSGEADGGL